MYAVNWQMPVFFANFSSCYLINDFPLSLPARSRGQNIYKKKSSLFFPFLDMGETGVRVRDLATFCGAAAAAVSNRTRSKTTKIGPIFWLSFRGNVRARGSISFSIPSNCLEFLKHVLLQGKTWYFCWPILGMS